MSVATTTAALEEYKRLEKLGEGTYGVVYKCVHKPTQRITALKKIKVDPHEEGIPATTLREVSLLKELKHPCIIELERSLYVNGELFLIFNFMDNDLKQYLENCVSNLDAPLLKSFSYLLIEGVRFCHSHRTLHRDLKPQNILISGKGDLKIADFGLGREHGLPITKLTHEVVTLWYRPPEILLGQEKYSGAADVWGVGCIIAEMGTRRPLFPGDSEIDQLFQIFKLLGTPSEQIWPGVSKLPEFKPHFPMWRGRDLSEVVRKSNLDSQGVHLIKQMLHYQPSKRITCKEALLHPWFDSIRSMMQRKLASNNSDMSMSSAMQSKENIQSNDGRVLRSGRTINQFTTPMDVEQSQ